MGSEATGGGLTTEIHLASSSARSGLPVRTTREEHESGLGCEGAGCPTARGARESGPTCLSAGMVRRSRHGRDRWAWVPGARMG